ncbi:MAG: hypothetical protein KatS3mg129_2340 [Leptospiraceae bacterium]|nr:MAG: hypothetical protein KatS3mg129_2340 [Leptospiraceae bacterium]
MIKISKLLKLILLLILIEPRCLRHDIPRIGIGSASCGVSLSLLIGYTEDMKKELKSNGYTEEQITFMENQKKEIGTLYLFSCILLLEEQHEKRKEAGILGKIGIYK